MSDQIRPRRSVLFMPGVNERAMDKARGIDCDSVIFDLEDAVAPDQKAVAREAVVRTLQQGGYAHRELIVRANGLATPWWKEDVAAVASLDIAGMLFPKIETASDVAQIAEVMASAGGAGLQIWVMVETPLGVANADEIAVAHANLSALVMGTSDLVKELRARHTEHRQGIAYALQRCVIAARVAGIDILDGVHLDFRNLDAFRAVCEQGRDMGFDGKTLIHPTQVEIANAVFGVDATDVDHARRVMQAWEQATSAGKGVVEVDGKLVENLHVDEARRVLAFASALDR